MSKALKNKVKLNDIVNVKDFGAVADGTLTTAAGTNNTTAFQAAMDYALANGKAVYIPAGVYSLTSQVTVGSGVRVYGDGMYRTYLITSSSFTGNGLIWAAGAGGPPTTIEHLSVLGATSTGAGAGSTGIRASSNAVIMRHLWCGGFTTMYRLDGTDQHATDCWADVALASGVGFTLENGSIHLLDCVTFNCYTGILVNGSLPWATAEPDIGVTIVGCKIIQSGYSGISMTGAINTSVSDTKIHSPTAASKFTRDFITIDGGSNITLKNVQCTFGNDVSTSCVGIRQTGETWNLKVIDCSVIGADYGYSFNNAVALICKGNSARGCRTWGFTIASGSVGAVVTNNQSFFNGTVNTTDGGGFYLTNSSTSGKWVVSSNSAWDFGSTSKYGFYINASSTTSSKINLATNVVTNTATQYYLVGTTSNITQTANL